MAFVCRYSCHFIVVKQNYTPMQQSPWWWDFSEISGSKSLYIHSLQSSGKYCKKLRGTCWTSRGKWKKESFSWWIKLHIFYVEVRWEFHLGIRDCHPSCWADAVCSPLGQPEPLPSSLEIPRKKIRLVLTSSRGGFCSALLRKEGGCCKPVCWVRSSWARGENNGVLGEELLDTDMPLCN